MNIHVWWCFHIEGEAVVKPFLYPFRWDLVRRPYNLMNSNLFSITFFLLSGNIIQYICFWCFNSIIITWNKWLVFTKISYYVIEQHITLTCPLALFVYRSYYMTLFNTSTLHAGLWCRDKIIASHPWSPWFETQIILCGIWYFLLLL